MGFDFGVDLEPRPFAAFAGVLFFSEGVEVCFDFGVDEGVARLRPRDAGVVGDEVEDRAGVLGVSLKIGKSKEFKLPRYLFLKIPNSYLLLMNNFF